MQLKNHTRDSNLFGISVHLFINYEFQNVLCIYEFKKIKIH